MPSGIRSVTTRRNDQGQYQVVQIIFGPHHFLDLRVDEEGKVSLTLGATHHGFQADASQVWGELERIIYEVRGHHPDAIIDDIPPVPARPPRRVGA